MSLPPRLQPARHPLRCLAPPPRPPAPFRAPDWLLQQRAQQAEITAEEGGARWARWALFAEWGQP